MIAFLRCWFYRGFETSIAFQRGNVSCGLKLLGNDKFNHLTISLTLPLNKWGPNKWEFNILNGR